jgi:GcrA cell cycle regulator
MAWTDERVELLKRLWAEGLSARQIAENLGGVTRNAVIGKVHRLGLSGRATSSHVAPARARQKKAEAQEQRSATPSRPASDAKPAPQRQERKDSVNIDSKTKVTSLPKGIVTPVDEPFIPLENRVTIATLREGHCKWPIGDPAHEDFHFCGQKLDGEGVYCEFHAAKAYQPARRSSRKKGEVKKIASAG